MYLDAALLVQQHEPDGLKIHTFIQNMIA